MLRNDPSTDTGSRSWAQMAGIIFGRAAMRSGVIVLNDPDALSKAIVRFNEDKFLYNTCKDNAKKSVQKFDLKNIGKDWVDLMKLN